MPNSTGISAKAATPLSDWEHVQQSIKKILTTLVGSRVMRRLFGSRIPDLVDAKMTRRNVLTLYSAAAVALDKWEPRFRLSSAAIDVLKATGQIRLVLAGTYFPRGHLGDFTIAEDKTTRVIIRG